MILSIDSNDGLFQGFVVVGVSDTSVLNQLIKKIKTVKGIKDVQNYIAKNPRQKKEARGSSCRDMIIPECPTQSECNAFNDRYEKMKRFAEARKAYDDECHQGGDKGHQEQSKGWNEGAQNCKNKYDECIAKLNKLI